MALYKYANFLGQHKSGAFDHPFSPEQHVQSSGIYRCTGCGGEIAIEEGRCFPPESHHKHRPAQGPAKWQLVVAVQRAAED